MKKTLSTMAAAVLLASTAVAPVFAQTSPAPASPAPAAPMAPSAPAAKPADSAATPAPKMGADMAASGSYLTEQAEDQISANDYIGKSVYNAENKSIGDVNDLIFKEDGGLVAAVIGVGGFLGIGEKEVALPMDKITVTRDAQNGDDARLTTTETAEALQAAPEFKTLADKKAETDKTTTSSTSTPATGGATSPSTAPMTPAAPSK